jgi:hypothetical protein
MHLQNNRQPAQRHCAATGANYPGFREEIKGCILFRKLLSTCGPVFRINIMLGVIIEILFSLLVIPRKMSRGTTVVVAAVIFIFVVVALVTQSSFAR